MCSMNKRARWREFSLILTIARLPAAKIAVSGMKLRFNGKFHGTMTPTTPTGCGTTRLLASPNTRRSIERRCGFIHSPRCLRVLFRSSSTGTTSASSVSWRERWP